jgi:hypothetical protein
MAAHRSGHSVESQPLFLIFAPKGLLMQPASVGRQPLCQRLLLSVFTILRIVLLLSSPNPSFDIPLPQSCAYQRPNLCARLLQGGGHLRIAAGAIAAVSPTLERRRRLRALGRGEVVVHRGPRRAGLRAGRGGGWCRGSRKRWAWDPHCRRHHMLS